MGDDLTAKLDAKKLELANMHQKKLDEMDAKLQDPDLNPEMKKKIELDKIQLNAAFARKEVRTRFNALSSIQKYTYWCFFFSFFFFSSFSLHQAALDREADENAEALLMDPEDDPLLLHVEVLDGELDADGDGIKDKISQEDFSANARFLINKVYYRQNTYLESCQYCDGEDFKLLLPITITTLLASIIGFLASSPLLENHPRKVYSLCPFLIYIF